MPNKPTKKEILFVDDEDVITRMSKNMLEKLGYHVTARTSSLGALETFQEKPNHFDLVITDQTMPNLIGYELAGTIIQIRPDIPVILCTGDSAFITEGKSKPQGEENVS